MGQAKALLPWRGKTLLQFQVAQLLEAGVARVLVVLGSQAEALLPLLEGILQAKAILNPGYRSGRTSSIRAGVEQVSPEASSLLVLGVDQPRPSPLLMILLEAHEQAQALISIPKYRGKRGHPPVFSPALFPELLALSEERQGLREVMARHRDRVNEVDVGWPDVLLDLNTPQDYERALASAPAPP